MKTNKKIVKLGLKARLFLSLMVVTVLGLLLKFPILYPLQLVFNRPTEYTSTHYSYKPGQSGYTFDFFVLNDDNLFFELSTGIVMLMVFLFYIGLFSGINVVLQVAKQNLKIAKRDFIITAAIALLLFGIPEIVSWDTLLGINKRGVYIVRDRIYTPDKAVWEIGEQRLKGVIIEDGKSEMSDTIELVINKVKDGKVTSVLSEKVPAIGKRVSADLFGDSLWIFIPDVDYVKTYNTTTEEVIIKNKEDLERKLGNEVLAAGIESFRVPHSFVRDNIIDVMTNDGQSLYLLMDRGIIIDQNSYSPYKTEKYILKSLSRHRSILFSYKHKHMLSNRWEQKVFLEAEILYYTDDVIIIRSKPDIGEDTRYSISAFSLKDAVELWQIKEGEISFLDKIYGKVFISVHNIDDKTILNFYDAFSMKGSVEVSDQNKLSVKEGTLDIFDM